MTKNENKLLDLFNQYNLSPDMTGWEICNERDERDWENMSVFYKQYICSKHFWFVKRLVDNDWIDTRLIPLRLETHWENSDVTWGVIKDYEVVLAMLSLKENPIKYLDSILI